MSSKSPSKQIALPESPDVGVWRIELLGGLRAYPPGVRAGGEEHAAPVEAFRTHRTALLLARLALLPNRAHAREELADLLWPDVPADRGRARLTQTLVFLREALGMTREDGWIVADHKTIRLTRGHVQTDVAEWEAAARNALSAAPNPAAIAQLRAALSADRGELVPGFYDDWLCDERNRLASLRDEMEARLAAWESEAARFATSSPRPEILDAPPRGAGTSITDTCDAPSLPGAPLFLTRFFGRDAERGLLADLLREESFARLVTLLGMGGTGKTRLAVEAAQAALTTAEQTWGWAAFVPLESARTREQMESTLLAAIGAPLPQAGQNKPTDDLLAAAIKHLNNQAALRGNKSGQGGGRLLLVLDNLEQLEDRAAPFVGDLLARVPRLTILATSRQPVGIAGERELLLRPLGGDGSSTSAVATRDDVSLFVDRARLARAGFALTAANQDSVGRLCDRLEGVPLALELAATWMRVSTPAQIADRLSHRFDVLTRGGMATTSPAGSAEKRHQSLRAAVAWSYDLLGPALQDFWIQMAAFRGGWTTDAARAVACVNNVEEPLLRLAERSLIIAEFDEDTGAMRYRMLESLREFALGHLQMRGDDFYADTCLRHARYFDDLSREAHARTVDGRGVRGARRLLEPELDNLRGVFGRLQEVREGMLHMTPTIGEEFVAAAVRSVVATIWRFGAEARSYLDLAAQVVSVLLPARQAPLRAALLSAQGTQRMGAGDYEAARRMLREGLALWESLGEKAEAATCKSRMGALECHSGDSAKAFSLWSEVLEFARKAGNLRQESAMLSNLAAVETDPVRRRALAEQAVFLDQTHWPGSTSHACSVHSLGLIAFHQGDCATARERLREAHEIALADGSPGMIAVSKVSLGIFYSESGEPLDEADALMREAQALYEQLEEHPRIAATALSQFHVALKRGNADAALRHAQVCLNKNRDASLIDAAAWREAREEIIRQLCDAGYRDAAAALQRAVPVLSL